MDDLSKKELDLKEEVRLPCAPESVARARQVVRSALQGKDQEQVELAELAVSEAATNAVLHANTDFVIRIFRDSDIRIEIEDFSTLVPFSKNVSQQASTGRGLDLIAALSASHGTFPTEDGKVVWFTLNPAETSVSMEANTWGLIPAARIPEEDTSVSLRNFIPILWFAAQEQHGAFIRELMLAQELPFHLLQKAESASDAITRFATIQLNLQRGLVDLQPPVFDRDFNSSTWEPVRISLNMHFSEGSSNDFSALQDVLDHAEALASSGKLLTPPSLPEIVAVRDWVCDQVVSQLEGAPPAPWSSDELMHDFYDHPSEMSSDNFEFIKNSSRNIMAADKLNRILAVSSSLAKVLGWKAEDLVGKRISSITPERFREAHVAGVTHHLATRERKVLGHPVLMPALRADGKEVLCRFVIDTLEIRPGQEVYMAEIDPAGNFPSSAADTHRDPRLEVLEVLPTPYMVLTPDLKIAAANPAYLKLVGKSYEDLKGVDIFEVFPSPLESLDATGRPPLLTSLETARVTRKPSLMEADRYDILNSDGLLEEHSWSVLSIPVFDGESLEFYIQEVHDVTNLIKDSTDLI